MPGFFLVGLDDQADRVKGFRITEKFYEEHGYPGVFRFVEGRGHDYMPQYDREAFPFLLKHTRVKYPKEFAGYYFTYENMKGEEKHNSEHYWLQALVYGRRGTASKVTVEGNVIDIEAEDLTEARVHLNDEIVDLDRPVTIRLNGKEVHKGRVERSVDFLLHWFEERRDARRLFWNGVVVKAGS